MARKAPGDVEVCNGVENFDASGSASWRSL
jgi:hypothetical protein